jgi:hypothetical protein
MTLALASTSLGCTGPQLQEDSQLETAPGDLGLINYCIDPSSTEPDQEYDVYIDMDEVVMLGTCGITESSAEGDTALSLYDPEGRLAATNDNGAAYGCGLASRMELTASAGGYYKVRIGCADGASCCGTLAISRRRALISFSARNTNNAVLNTYNKQFKFDAGDVVRVSTCAANAYGASATGDTYLRLFHLVSGAYSEVASNNDGQGCGSAAELVYTIPQAGYYQFRVGCAENTACSGNVAVYVE